jgi:type I restriction enzyme R subunit
MSNTPKNASEKTFQENFCNELTKYRWEATPELDGNTHKVTVDTLIANWRAELNRLNADKLEGVPLTDNEFKLVLSKVSSIKNSYEAAKVLAAENGKGKIDGIFRDSNPLVRQKQITLTIFTKAQVRGGDSHYQIAREVCTPNGNRFDAVLLFCGLPLINIEMKRSDKSLDNAYEQFKRYYQDGEYVRNFMAFSQMMVIASDVATEYFATPKNIESFNPSFRFHWSDKDNRIINDWREIVKTFLMIPMAHQMIGDYLVLNEAENEEDRCHLLMRPYQVYALQAIELAAFGSDNEDKVPHGGFVWHTTGSGKTITSFKTALFLSTRAGFDKIVFMVDRRELDANTSKRFTAYAAYEPVDVDDTAYTFKLKQQLKNPKRGIVVTTTFKLNSLVKELTEKKDESLSKKKFVFLIDEAHRTTMGEMMVNITTFFKDNGLFYGFTGTPLFDENNVDGMKRNIIDDEGRQIAVAINTTEKLFGNMLHKYTIDEAIRDKNVLGFHVDCINTGEFKSYDDLRDKLTEALMERDETLTRREASKKTAALSNAELESKAYTAGIFEYQDETHIPIVVKDIIENWDKQSQKRNFNAILTTGRIERAVCYLGEFQRQQKDRESPIHVAVTISFGMEETVKAASKKYADGIFAQYETFTGQKFIFGDEKNGEEAYFEDLISRLARGGSGRNDKNIDIVIVADQLLTGYDSKYLNTLYVDRALQLQSLVQAYSRTNRLYGSDKEFGSIINYQFPALTACDVDKALKLYGSGGSNSPAIVPTYEVAVAKLKELLHQMKQILPVPANWADLKNDEQKMTEFKEAYLDSNAQMSRVSQYYECVWSNDTFGMESGEWDRYTGAFKNLFPTENPPKPPKIIRPVEGDSKVVIAIDITAGYIIDLIGKKLTGDGGNLTIDSESLRLILEKIQEFSDTGNAEQASLLKDFVTDIQDGKIKSDKSADLVYKDWHDDRLNREIETFASTWGCDGGLLLAALLAYNPSVDESIPRLDDIIDSVDIGEAIRKSENPLEHNMALTDAISPWLSEIRRIYLEG